MVATNASIPVNNILGRSTADAEHQPQIRRRAKVYVRDMGKGLGTVDGSAGSTHLTRDHVGIWLSWAIREFSLAGPQTTDFVQQFQVSL